MDGRSTTTANRIVMRKEGEIEVDGVHSRGGVQTIDDRLYVGTMYFQESWFVSER